MRHFDLLLLDAGCLLNLCATGRLREIAEVLPYQLCVAGYVAEQEALYVRRAGPTDVEEAQIPVDLSPLYEKCLMQLMCLEDSSEEATFVNLAAHLDEGEAIAGALAFHRGCSVATDDRKARRALGQLNPPVKLVSTLQLLKHWKEEAAAPQDELTRALADMQAGASFIPGPRDPLYRWWLSAVRGPFA